MASPRSIPTPAISIPDDSIPKEFFCTTTLELMTSPVTTPHGHSYERKFVEEWVKVHHVSPSTTVPLSLEALVPNNALKSLIETYEQHMMAHKRELDAATAQTAKLKALALKWRDAFRALKVNVTAEVESKEAVHVNEIARLNEEIARLNEEIERQKIVQRRIKDAEVSKLKASHLSVMKLLLEQSLQPLVAHKVNNEVKPDAKVAPAIPPRPIAISRKDKEALVLFGRKSKPGLQVLPPQRKHGRSPV